VSGHKMARWTAAGLPPPRRLPTDRDQQPEFGIDHLDVTHGAELRSVRRWWHFTLDDHMIPRTVRSVSTCHRRPRESVYSTAT
jgi:hypothetical protein